MKPLERIILWAVITGLFINVTWWNYWMLRLLYAGH